MKKVIRLTEADLTRLVRRVIKEQGAILPGSQQDIAKRAQEKIQSIKNRRSSYILAPPTVEDVQVFNQIKKELSSVVKPTVNSENELSFTAKFPDEVIDGKQVPVAPGTDFYFDFRPAGEAKRIGGRGPLLGNTLAYIFAENPEIGKLISQLPGYNSKGAAEFFINNLNMKDLLPKIKNILQKASVVGLEDFSSLYPTRDRSVVSQGRRER